jgi:hypothetical protein
MACNTLVDITTLSPKFQELYTKAKDFVEVRVHLKLASAGIVLVPPFD